MDRVTKKSSVVEYDIPNLDGYPSNLTILVVSGKKCNSNLVPQVALSGGLCRRPTVHDCVKAICTIYIF
jgi:hypothetical protein